MNLQLNKAVLTVDPTAEQNVLRNAIYTYIRVSIRLPSMMPACLYHQF